MAVYKATYCYPFLNAIDAELKDGEVIWFKCKIDTSNKNVTGYSIRILDENNNIIFPNLSHISPISELPQDLGDGINTGVNGTYLNIPFFQTLAKKITQSYQVLYYDTANNVWKELNSTENSKYEVNGNEYKWEITLYQGKGTITEDISGAKIISYDSPDFLNALNYDMVLTEGTVLGSTPSRIQIASSNDESGILPLNTDNTGVILLGTYMEIIGGTTTRSYVQNYDQSYGHVYPLQTDVPNVVLTDSDQYVQFFKHSNNANDIDANDIVKWATTENISLDSSTTSVDGGILQAGDYVLVKDQTNAQENGIYRVVLDAAQIKVLLKGTATSYFNRDNENDKTNILIVPSSSEKADFYAWTDKSSDTPQTLYTLNEYPQKGDALYIYDEQEQTMSKDTTSTIQSVISPLWVRSGSYNTWGDFIGKIIYVQNGEKNGKKNFESLANSGGQLWVGESDKTSYSPLYFTEEKPILLFSQKLTDTVNFYYGDAGYQEYPDNITINNANIDGCIGRINDTILIDNSDLGSQSVCVYFISTINKEGNKITSYVLKKQKEYGTSPTPGEEIYFYITDGEKYGHTVNKYAGYDLEKDSKDLSQAIILKNSSTKTFISPYLGLKEQMALKIKTINKWLKVKAINNTLWYIEHDEQDFTPLLSYSKVDQNVPYKYELRTFFKVSDENPFYSYKTPTLKIYNSTDINNPIVGSTDISTRYISLIGDYSQEQGASWESYRWVLTDVFGNILQDTGKKYDKELKVSFYGLSNDRQNEAVVYYITLFIEDEVGFLLEKQIEVNVTAYSVQSARWNFEAEYDCNTNSVLLRAEATTYVMPSKEENGSTEGEVYYITNGKGVQYLSGALRLEDEIFSSDHAPYFDPYTLDYIGNNVPGKPSTSLSDVVTDGIKYSHYFLSKTATKSEADKTLKLADANGNFTVQTKFTLNDNYCGDFLTINVGNMSLILTIPDNFIDTDGTTLNNNRNKISFSFNKGTEVLSSGYLKNNEENDLTFFDITGVNTSYYLEPRNASRKSDEYLHTSLGGYYLWGKNDLQDRRVSVVPLKQCYNLCLKRSTSASDNDSCSYWFEDYNRTYRQDPSTGNVSLNFISKEEVNNPKTISLKWPEEGDEDNSYWSEGPDILPSSWGAVFSSIPGYFEHWVAQSRHPNTFSKYPVTLTIQGKNTISLTTAATVSGSIDGTKHITTIKNDDNTYMKIIWDWEK